ncbi:MAG: amidophosphoribosyltransferase [Flavobacteriaceae bacterium]|nr:MAG: amidophosphoribosyltransferase [Flavobacteriaceae bacterium]
MTSKQSTTQFSDFYNEKGIAKKGIPYLRNLLKSDDPLDQLGEECGIFGVYSNHAIDTFSIAEFGMFALQHRGQEASGVSILKEGQILTSKKDDLVLDMFKKIKNPDDFQQGNAAIGHTRYTTAGDNSTKNFQPFYAVNQFGKTHLSFVHNGNVVGIEALRAQLIEKDLPFLGSSDSEVMLRMIQSNLDKGIIEAIRLMSQEIRGAYSILMLTKDGLIAFRDPNGIRPLSIGKIDDNTHVFASETPALQAVGASFVREVEPGEIVWVNDQGIKSYPMDPSLDKPSKCTLCSFEYIYFARPDSILEDIDVYEVRRESGKKLFEQAPVEADLVIGVPDSGIPAAVGYSEASGIPYEPILIKNRYMSRSFIIPTQAMRERVVNLKLNPVISRIKGKRLVVIDDSVVRGTTSKRLIKILLDAGAKEVHFRSASPPIIAPCFLGIDMPSKKDLISANLDKESLREFLGVDSLDFLSVENLKEILKQREYCFGCFTENYPVSKD